MERGNLSQVILATLARNGRLTATECARVVYNDAAPGKIQRATVNSLLSKLALRSMVRRYAEPGKRIEYGPAPPPRAALRQPIAPADHASPLCQHIWSSWFNTDLAAAA